MAKIVTITNPLTGQPAQVDQLDHTAQQIDDGLNIARGVSNPNLLDNWYFGNPVDQRGGYVVPPGKSYYQLDWSAMVGTTDAYYPVIRRTGENNDAVISISGTEYVVGRNDAVRGYTGTGYGIDRWQSTANGHVLIEDDGIRFVCTQKYDMYVRHVLDPNAVKLLSGKKVTLSLLCKDKTGSISLHVYFNNQWGTALVPIENSITSTTFIIPADCTSMRIEFGGDDVGELKVQAVKLELGSQQTLAHQDADGNWVLNEIPDYGEQLRRCQRYYLSNKQRNAYGKSTSATVAYVDIPTPVTMRALPAIETGVIGHVICNGVKTAIASINPAKLNDESITLQLVLNTSVSVDYPVFLTDTKYALSADL